MLTDPARFGGDPADAFTVVAPSLPGYGFSFRPNQPRFGVEEIADVFARLMTDVLGYRRFAAQGGDWGAFITSRLGLQYPERLAGIHLNLLAVRRDPALPDKPTDEEQRYIKQLQHWQREETGYQWIQGTRPQTLAYGLSDSPVGLAAWIVEKFRTWSDCDGEVERRFSKDTLLTNVTLYWVTGAINSSFWPYYARFHRPWPIPTASASRYPRPTPRFPARSCCRPGPGPSARTTSSGGRSCPPVVTSPPSKSPGRWPPTSGPSSALFARRGRPAGRPRGPEPGESGRASR